MRGLSEATTSASSAVWNPKLIRSGLHERKAKLVALMDVHLTDETRGLLDNLFETPDDQSRYRLILLKKLSQVTKPVRIKEFTTDFKTLAELHCQLENIFVTA